MTSAQVSDAMLPIASQLEPSTGIHNLAHSTPVALITLDHSCRIQEGNAAADELAGMSLKGRRFCEAYLNQTSGENPCATCPMQYALHGVERRTRPRWLTLVTGSSSQAVLFKAATVPTGAAVTLIPSSLVDDADLRRREMLASAIHDLRLPVTSQSVAIDLLAAQLPSDSSLTDARMLLTKLRHSTSVLAVTIDDLLNKMLGDLKQQSVNPQTLDVLPALEHLVWYMQPMLARRRQTVRLDVPKDLTVFADPTALEHIVMNLVFNAHKYSVDQDRIVLAARARPALNVTEISVRDHGPGIPRTERRRVFDRFYRGEGGTRQRGAGLGLNIVQGLVERHGGSVGLRTARGGGALFWLRFPNSTVSSAG